MVKVKRNQTKTRSTISVIDSDIYLTKIEHNLYAQEEDQKDFEEESEQYQRGYLHAIDEFHKKIQLRSSYVILNKGRLNLN